MALKHVQPGDSYPRSADRLNQTADAVNWVQGHQLAPTIPPGGGLYEPARVWLRNGTCDDWDEFDAIAIDSPVIRPHQRFRGWAEGKPVYVGVVPETQHDRIAILEEPCPSCTIRRAVISGLVRTRINVSDESHNWATTVAGSRTLVSTSATTSPVEIVWKESGTGLKWADVLLSMRRDAPVVAPTTQTTLPDELETPVCSGTCKWISYDGVTWYPTPVSTCAAATTTTGTTTTGGPTSTTTPCCPDLEIDADPTTTTTASGDPTTTTTPEECECSYPTFCPSEIDQCTYTQCVRGANNTMPNCAGTTTTAAPVTTTTCDCGAVVAPPPCSAGCDWVGLPGGVGGAWRWVKTSDGCAGNCPCGQPTSDPYCNTDHTDCVLIPPVPPPPSPVCGGQCVWVYVAALSQFYLADDGCTNMSGCGCQPPSMVSPCGLSGCCEIITPCVSPSASPTTGTTAEYDGCQYTCLGIPATTTTAGPATTTTPVIPTCDTGGCRWKSNETATGWVQASDSDCPVECPCVEPTRDPYDTCEIITVGCFGVPTTSTSPGTTTTGGPTTTTTQGPTTTTLAPTTTTTCGDCPLSNSGYCSYQKLAGQWVHVPAADNCPQDCYHTVNPTEYSEQTGAFAAAGSECECMQLECGPTTTTTGGQATTPAGSTTTTGPVLTHCCVGGFCYETSAEWCSSQDGTMHASLEECQGACI